MRVFLINDAPFPFFDKSRVLDGEQGIEKDVGKIFHDAFCLDRAELVKIIFDALNQTVDGDAESVFVEVFDRKQRKRKRA